jgi:hypothetical protein
VKRLVRAKAEEGSECAERAESALVWQRLVGCAKDEIPTRLRAAHWQSASQADLASIGVVGVLVNEPVEQGEKTAAVNDTAVEVVEVVAEIEVVGVAVVAAVVTAVAIAAETVQASVYAAGLEPEVVE